MSDETRVGGFTATTASVQEMFAEMAEMRREKEQLRVTLAEAIERAADLKRQLEERDAMLARADRLLKTIDEVEAGVEDFKTRLEAMRGLCESLSASVAKSVFAGSGKWATK